MENKKYLHYSHMICGKISELFNEDSDSEFKVDINDFENEDNLKQFIHALSNVAPTYFLNKLTGDNTDCLEHNHKANHLVFEYSEKEQNNGK